MLQTWKIITYKILNSFKKIQGYRVCLSCQLMLYLRLLSMLDLVCLSNHTYYKICIPFYITVYLTKNVCYHEGVKVLLQFFSKPNAFIFLKPWFLELVTVTQLSDSQHMMVWHVVSFQRCLVWIVGFQDIRSDNGKLFTLFKLFEPNVNHAIVQLRPSN